MMLRQRPLQRTDLSLFGLLLVKVKGEDFIKWKTCNKVMVVLSHPWGMTTVPIEEWIEHGPGLFERIRPYRIICEDGIELPDSLLPFRYQNNDVSRYLIRRGLLENPWRYSHGVRIFGSPSLSYGTRSAYMHLIQPTWEQVHKALVGLNPLISNRVLYSTGIGRFSIAIVRENPTRVEFMLNLDHRYRILDPSLPPLDDDDEYIVDVGDGIDYAYLYQTIPKDDAIELMHALYHENTLPPRHRWERALSI